MAAARNLIFLCVIFCHSFSSGFVDYMKIGDDCEGDDDCSEIPNSMCPETECTCLHGYVPAPNNTICLKLATKAGDKCEIPEQCGVIASSKCLGGECVVAPAVDVNPLLNKFRNDCVSNFECSSGHCQNGFCVETPVDVNVVGRPCTEDSECRIPDSACVARRCLCKDYFVPSQNLKSCLAKAETFGDKCTESIQCLAIDGVCLNGICSKKMIHLLGMTDNSVPKENPLLLGSMCETDEDCSHITNAACKEKVCECTENYVTSVSASSCLPKATHAGESCEIDKQCEGVRGTVCTQNKCLPDPNTGRSLGNGAPDTFVHSSKTIMAAISILKIFLI